MALPSTAITRLDLASTFSEFDLAASRKKFIGPRVFRPRLVGLQAADVGKIPLEALLLIQSDVRASGAGYKRGDFEFGKFDYATEERGWEEPLDDRQLALYRDLLDAEAIHSQRAMDFVLRNYEIDCATALYDTAVWTGAALTTAITEEWDTVAAAIPIQDVEAARVKVIAGSGLDPNALILNRKQFQCLRNCDQITSRIKYWGGDDPKNISPAMVAEVLQIDMVIVAGGYKNTGNEAATASMSTIWGDEYAMVARVAVTDDPQEPCVGRTFIWTGDGAGVGNDEELAVIVEEYREEKVRGSVLRARNDRVIKIMYPEAAHLLSNVITI